MVANTTLHQKKAGKKVVKNVIAITFLLSCQFEPSLKTKRQLMLNGSLSFILPRVLEKVRILENILAPRLKYFFNAIRFQKYYLGLGCIQSKFRFDAKFFNNFCNFIRNILRNSGQTYSQKSTSLGVVVLSHKYGEVS